MSIKLRKALDLRSGRIIKISKNLFKIYDFSFLIKTDLLELSSF